ncbi:MAG: DUF721 domain-containing protein [Alphaproteobacteria bacterium]|nr:DUF721 domain-containing protein [Alphaproteobacteria bacterium]
MKRSFGLQTLDQKITALLKPTFNSGKKGFILINNLTKNWPEIVGKKYAKFCHPLSARFGKSDKSATLTIAVYNPAVGFFLESNSEIILERIAILYGFKSIAKIVIKQDPKIIQQEAKPEKILPAKQQKILEEKIQNVADRELAEVLRKLGNNVLSKNLP